MKVTLNVKRVEVKQDGCLGCYFQNMSEEMAAFLGDCGDINCHDIDDLDKNYIFILDGAVRNEE